MRLIDADELRKKAVPHTRGEYGYKANIKKWAVLVSDLDDAPTINLEESSKWISVGEKLPEKRIEDVLMYFDTGHMMVGFWYGDNEGISFWCAYSESEFYEFCEYEPTHWMPLPKPPIAKMED